MVKRKIRIALLLCDTPVSTAAHIDHPAKSQLPAVVAESGTCRFIRPGHGMVLTHLLTDLDIYRQWLQESITAYPDAAISQDIELILDGYDVVDKHEYPAREKLVAGAVDGYDAVMLTGSSEFIHTTALRAEHSAYDMSNPFVLPLIDFVRSVATSPATEHVKIIGVCFGHQIISLALGGDCVKGEKGWEIGVYANQLTPEGQFWWRGEETQGGRETIVSGVDNGADFYSMLSKWCGRLIDPD